MAKKKFRRKATKQEKIIAEYNKERRRIQRFIKSAENRGYTFPENALPAIPKRISEGSIRRLKKITSVTLYKKAKSTPDAKKKKPKKKRRKGAGGRPPVISEIILNNIIQMIETWAPNPGWSKGLAEAKTKDRNILKNILEGVIKSDGRQTVAKRINENAVEVVEMVEAILYDSGGRYAVSGREGVQVNLLRLSAIFTGRSLTFDEADEIIEEMEQNEDYSDVT